MPSKGKYVSLKAWLKLPVKWQDAGDLTAKKGKEPLMMSKAIPDHSYGVAVKVCLNLVKIWNLQVQK